MKLSFWLIALSFCLPGALYNMDYTISRCDMGQKHNAKLYKMRALQNDSNICLGYIEYSFNGENLTGWIDKLFVKKEHRCKGIAVQLLFEACKHLKQQGCTKVSGEPGPLADNDSYLSLLYNETDLQAAVLLQLLSVLVKFSNVPLSSELFLYLEASSLYMYWRYSRSRVDFYKKFGAKQSSFSSTASYDLTHAKL